MSNGHGSRSIHRTARWRRTVRATLVAGLLLTGACGESLSSADSPLDLAPRPAATPLTVCPPAEDLLLPPGMAFTRDERAAASTDGHLMCGYTDGEYTGIILSVAGYGAGVDENYGAVRKMWKECVAQRKCSGDHSPESTAHDFFDDVDRDTWVAADINDISDISTARVPYIVGLIAGVRSGQYVCLADWTSGAQTPESAEARRAVLAGARMICGR